MKKIIIRWRRKIRREGKKRRERIEGGGEEGEDEEGVGRGLIVILFLSLTTTSCDDKAWNMIEMW